MENKKKKVIGRVELFVLLACIALIALILSGKEGCGVLRKTDEMQWIDRKGNPVE